MTEAKAEIEITPEMLEAGVAVYAAWQESDQWDYRILISDIFRTMASAKFEQNRKQSSGGDGIANFNGD